MTPIDRPTIPPMTSSIWLEVFMIPNFQILLIFLVLPIWALVTYVIYQDCIKAKNPDEDNSPPPIPVYMDPDTPSVYYDVGLA